MALIAQALPVAVVMLIVCAVVDERLDMVNLCSDGDPAFGLAPYTQWVVG